MRWDLGLKLEEPYPPFHSTLLGDFTNCVEEFHVLGHGVDDEPRVRSVGAGDDDAPASKGCLDERAPGAEVGHTIELKGLHLLDEDALLFYQALIGEGVPVAVRFQPPPGSHCQWREGDHVAHAVHEAIQPEGGHQGCQRDAHKKEHDIAALPLA